MSTGTAASPLSVSSGPPDRMRHRVARMAVVWAVFGAVVGAQSFAGADAIGLLSGTIAGVILLPWLGAFLGLIGGEAVQSLVGASCGCLVGVVHAKLWGDPILTYKINMGLMIGGIMGANYATVCALRRLRRRRSTMVLR